MKIKGQSDTARKRRLANMNCPKHGCGLVPLPKPDSYKCPRKDCRVEVFHKGSGKLLAWEGNNLVVEAKKRLTASVAKAPPKLEGVDTKVGKKALAWLKKKAIEDAKSGTHGSYHTTSSIIQNVDINHFYDSRDKAYRDMIRFLNHCEELGLVSNRHWGSPKQFSYIGPEVKTELEKYEKDKTAAQDAINSALRKLGLKGSLNRNHYSRNKKRKPHEYEVTINGAALVKLAEKKFTKD